jgi:hypothetical protein
MGGGLYGRQCNILEVNKTNINVLILFHFLLHYMFRSVWLQSGGYNKYKTVITELLG